MLRTYITVVSGMPRSGTSLMMQMLDAGGIPALTDGIRAGDPHNPHGYFEDARTKRLAQDSSWIGEARGRAVKVIYRLLPHLPREFAYRVLFMERDLEEVFDSQQDMLRSAASPAAGQDRERMVRALAAELRNAREWLGRQENIRSLAVPYSDLIVKPSLWTDRISDLLDGGLDLAAMVEVVDPALYRHRKARNR